MFTYIRATKEAYAVVSTTFKAMVNISLKHIYNRYVFETGLIRSRNIPICFGQARIIKSISYAHKFSFIGATYLTYVFLCGDFNTIVPMELRVILVLPRNSNTVKVRHTDHTATLHTSLKIVN